MSVQLVAWDDNNKRFNDLRQLRGAELTNPAQVEAYIAKPVAPEYTELVEALTEFFGAIGMHAVCKLCFEGKPLPAIEGNDYYRHPGHHGNHGAGPGKGCCYPCTLQGTDKCVSKPLGCAVWMCNYTLYRFPNADKVRRKVQTILWNAGVGQTYFTAPRPTVYNDKQKRAIKRAIRLLRSERHPE